MIEKEDLNLENHNIGNDGAHHIASKISQNVVKSLNLSNNKIGLNGIKAIAKALITNTSLTRLTIDSNYIGVLGAAEIATALEKNTTLTALSMRENKICDDGANAIALALSRRPNNKLSVLDVEDNEIGEASLRGLNQYVIINNMNNNEQQRQRRQTDAEQLIRDRIRRFEEGIDEIIRRNKGQGTWLAYALTFPSWIQKLYEERAVILGQIIDLSALAQQQISNRLGAALKRIEYQFINQYNNKSSI